MNTIEADCSQSDDLDTLREEFREFLYIVSHDLRSPIRHIRSFKKLLLEDIDIELNEEQQDYNRYIDEAVELLDRQLSGLLRLSRVNTTNFQHSTIDLKQLSKEIIERKKEEYDISEDVVFTIQQLPNIDSCIMRVNNIFEELIDNAFKFRRTDTPMSLSIAVEDQGQDYFFSIIDNGIGISPNNYLKALQPLKQLHHAADYKGTGIGLTLAKRSVTALGGDFQLNSQDGLQVHFSLPKRLKD